jgi:hypothetical protein
MAATVVGDHPKTMFQEEHHLTVPIVRAQWPAVMEEERLTGAPILVEDLSAIPRGEYRQFSSFGLFRWTALCVVLCGSIASLNLIWRPLIQSASGIYRLGTQMPRWFKLESAILHQRPVRHGWKQPWYTALRCSPTVMFPIMGAPAFASHPQWGQLIWLKCGEKKHYF